MKYLAHVKKGTPIDNLWRQQSRLGGLIGNVSFKLINHIYASGELDASQIGELRHNSAIQIEVIAVNQESVVKIKEPETVKAPPVQQAAPTPTPSHTPAPASSSVTLKPSESATVDLNTKKKNKGK